MEKEEFMSALSKYYITLLIMYILFFDTFFMIAIINPPQPEFRIFGIGMLPTTTIALFSVIAKHYKKHIFDEKKVEVRGMFGRLITEAHWENISEVYIKGFADKGWHKMFVLDDGREKKGKGMIVSKNEMVRILVDKRSTAVMERFWQKPIIDRD